MLLESDCCLPASTSPRRVESGNRRPYYFSEKGVLSEVSRQTKVVGKRPHPLQDPERNCHPGQAESMAIALGP